jgi:hypothetical protein
MSRFILFTITVFLLLSSAVGCGISKSRRATQQLLMSDAVDRSVSAIDFRPLAGQKVYFDTRYLEGVKGSDFVNAHYIISSLRQQMVAAQCLLQNTLEEADYVVEARVGALGTDEHDVTYGMPASNIFNAAATLVPGAPPLPALPEISFGKRSNELGAAKIGVFAYNRRTRQPVWQSGLSVATSTSKNAWWLGIGPFQSGTIHDGPMFAGSRIRVPLVKTDKDEDVDHAQPVPYREEYIFDNISPRRPQSRVAFAGSEEPVRGRHDEDVRQPMPLEQPIELQPVPADWPHDMPNDLGSRP